VIGFTVVAVALHVWRSDPPKAATFAVQPDVAVARRAA